YALSGCQLLYGSRRTDQLGRCIRRERPCRSGAHRGNQQTRWRHGSDLRTQSVPAPDEGRCGDPECDPGCLSFEASDNRVKACLQCKMATAWSPFFWRGRIARSAGRADDNQAFWEISGAEGTACDFGQCTSAWVDAVGGNFLGEYVRDICKLARWVDRHMIGQGTSPRPVAGKGNRERPKRTPGNLRQGSGSGADAIGR